MAENVDPAFPKSGGTELRLEPGRGCSGRMGTAETLRKGAAAPGVGGNLFQGRWEENSHRCYT